MMFPTRLSFITYNLWLTERWPARAPALARRRPIIGPCRRYTSFCEGSHRV